MPKNTSHRKSPARLRETLLAVHRYTRRYGQSPSLRELGDELGVGLHAIYRRLEHLQTQGLLVKGELHRTRTLTLTDAGLAELGARRLPLRPFVWVRVLRPEEVSGAIGRRL